MDEVKNFCRICNRELGIDETYLSKNILRCLKDNEVLIFKKLEGLDMKTDEKMDKVNKVINFVENTLKVKDKKAARSIVGKAYTVMRGEK